MIAFRIATQFIVLLAFWLVLSGQYSALFVGMGVVSAALVTSLTHRVVAASLGPVSGGLKSVPVRAWRSLLYGLWVLGKIPPAGAQIAYYVLHPRMPIEPSELRFRTHLESQVARTLLANSITLVPGTLTVSIDDDELTVHAFIPSSADDLVTGAMQNRIASVFLQEPAPAPEVVWSLPSAPQPKPSKEHAP